MWEQTHGMNPTYILGCAQTIYINAGPKRNSYFHEKFAIDKKVSTGPQKKVEFTLIRNECESTRQQIFLSSTSRIQINKCYEKPVITTQIEAKKVKGENKR